MANTTLNLICIRLSPLPTRLVYTFKIKNWLIQAEKRYKMVTEGLQSSKDEESRYGQTATLLNLAKNHADMIRVLHCQLSCL